MSLAVIFLYTVSPGQAFFGREIFQPYVLHGPRVYGGFPYLADQFLNPVDEAHVQVFQLHERGLRHGIGEA